MSVVLLVETSQGDTVAVRFPSAEAAREWEDLHEDKLTGRGVATVVGRAEALRLARV